MLAAPASVRDRSPPRNAFCSHLPVALGVGADLRDGVVHDSHRIAAQCGASWPAAWEVLSIPVSATKTNFDFVCVRSRCATSSADVAVDCEPAAHVSAEVRRCRAGDECGTRARCGRVGAVRAPITLSAPMLGFASSKIVGEAPDRCRDRRSASRPDVASRMSGESRDVCRVRSYQRSPGKSNAARVSSHEKWRVRRPCHRRKCGRDRMRVCLRPASRQALATAPDSMPRTTYRAAPHRRRSRLPAHAFIWRVCAFDARNFTFPMKRAVSTQRSLANE